ncbi:MAG: UDP-N-acetylglucosamine 2-epimerase (non-hydrolyzing) [Candidatus Magasanikbacteria bacterium]|nr:UDP-N-acetylglucosamine 2-epimerase (non-hydrolyzing) [Candidatus Magasanikbacteria bacterium]|tara:strand:+ start:1714 stop:2757 length:1044 start_codon:yes stop_codon:yes gene_type:complete
MFKKIAIIGGARPNFMKVAPLCKEFEKQGLDYILINTGQHFSKDMSKDFFDEFNIAPNITLEPSRNTTMSLFCDIMMGLEKVFEAEKPDLVLVVGDVNSTLAGALVANKLGIKLGHIEAGLRSFNTLMPEEHNRVLTDHISDYLFITSEDGVENLKKEGIVNNIFFVGNIMMDTLASFVNKVPSIDEEYYFCTLHRAENVDNKEVFCEILDALEEISKNNTIYLPLHPRTEKMAKQFGFTKRMESIFTLLSPLSYSDCVKYQKSAKLVLTDSGGIQEETSFLGVPCITLRSETERPVTVEVGTNSIGGVRKKTILDVYYDIDFNKKDVTIPFWDGKTAERIVGVLKE